MNHPYIEDTKIAELFNEITKGGEVATPSELSQIMKKIGATPYIFVRQAINSLLVRDDAISADKWVKYSKSFENKYWDNEREESNFQIINDLAAAFIAQHAFLAQIRERL